MEIIKFDDGRFPELLKGIKNCPKELYCVGNISLLNSRCLAVVGSRTTNPYGRKTTKDIAEKVARSGITIVSGMAKGIDTAAHEAALDAGGNTIAVLGCGTDICFPPENAALKEEIERYGLVISEFKPGTEPMPYNFPLRNRIISGLSEATVVVQARNRSGALITAELAAEQNREVFAVPGNIDSAYNLGNNKLISEGAIPLISADDILEHLGVNKFEYEDAVKMLSANELHIFNILLENGEMTADEIGFKLGKSPAYVNPILSVMEMKGFIFSAIGKFYIAKA